MAQAKFSPQLIEAIKESKPPQGTNGEATIQIHGPLQRLTALYERFRTFLDYQEERFIRRLAIRRILFRRLLIQGDRKTIGEDLIRELIRAAYLENDKYPVSIGVEIDDRLAKYTAGLPVIEQHYPPHEAIRMERRLLGIAAAEIEDLVNPPTVDRALLQRLETDIASYLGGEVTEEVRMIALRDLIKADSELMAWRLLADAEDGRLHDLWQAFIKDPAESASHILRELLRIDEESRGRELEAKCRRFQRLVPPYTIIADLAYHKRDQVQRLLDHPEQLDVVLDNLTEERIGRSESKLQRSMIRATVYIFVTKVIFGFAIEVPYELATLGRIDYLPLSINLLMPPVLMIVAGLGIRAPSRENNELLVRRAKLMLLDQPLPTLSDLEGSHRYRSGVANLFFSIFYLATYLITFGGLIWLLTTLGFNPISIVVFLFFLSVVGFFAFRIRASVRELAVIREREGILLLVFDFFALPFLRVGRWLAASVRQLNIFLFVLDFVIEAPLKIVFVALEDWFAFLREKREELG
ncbi:hypothetical protein HY523_00830 [Candidatus Berkelbacteria bacterium]|nr:hypothetical protein [Candidatus Berkelbacteria bacterium]